MTLNVSHCGDVRISEEYAENKSNPHSPDIGIVTIKGQDMLDDLTRLHLDAFGKHLNVCLGYGYIKTYLSWFVRTEGAIAIAAVDSRQNVIGYAIGAPTGYHQKIERELFWMIGGSLIMRPWLLFDLRFWSAASGRLKRFRNKGADPERGVMPEPTISLVSIGVALSHQRCGVGKILMGAFIDKARQLNARSLLLSVYRDGEAARAFYEKCGWQPAATSGKGVLVMNYFKLL